MTIIKPSDFKAIFEAVPGLYLILLPDLIINAVSDEYLNATMTRREEIMDRYLFDVFPDNPDDPKADGVSNLRYSLNAVIKTKMAHEMSVQKYDIRRPDGTFEERYWSPLNKPVVNENGELLYIIHSVVDVTHRVKNGQALDRANNEIKELYDQAPCGYLSVNADIYINNINQTLLKWLGYTAAEVIGKMKYEDLLSPESRADHLNTFEVVFADYVKNGYVNNLEYVFQRKDGSTFPALVNSIAVMDENGNFTKSRSTVFDNTERKKAEERLKASNKELESFSYSVSHDLRAPLRAVHGYTKILSEDYGNQLDEEANRLMNNIMNNAQKMGHLIDDLLNFSRLGRKELSITNVTTAQMVANICTDIKSEQNGHSPQFKLNELLPVEADAIAIKQVWINLISNAAKYSRLKESAVIEIGSEEKNDEVIFYVKDNGVGFDMRYVDKLFGVFQRLHAESEFEGTGVGLAIVHRIVTRHGGRVWAEGKKDEGAVFYFTLPKKIAG
jgi:PAS domain S-box-containing protein